jgi:molybdenum cofactor cytidylyltransferase
MIKIGALILSAGNSTRMGFPKALLKFDNEYTFIEKIIRQYQDFKCSRICTVVNIENQYLYDEMKSDIRNSTEKLINKYPEKGRFSSLKIGFSAMYDMDYIFIQNIDNPFAGIILLESLLSQIEDFDYCVPVFENRGGHPILVKNKIAKSAQNQPDDSILKDFLSQFSRKNIKTNSAEILLNINNAEEFEKYQKKEK